MSTSNALDANRLTTHSLRVQLMHMRSLMDAAWEEGRLDEHNRLTLRIRWFERELRMRVRTALRLVVPHKD